MTHKKNEKVVPVSLPSKLPMILSIVFLSISFLAIGIVLGKYLFSPASPASVSAVPTPVVSVPSTIPTTDPTINWKTYKNEKWGFEIKYPLDWFIKDTSLYSYDPGNYLGEKPIPEKIVKCDFIEGNDLSTVAIKSTEILQTGTPKITKLITEYKDHANFGPGSSTNTRYIFEQDTKEISLICFFFDETYEKTFDQILSTFKFTEKVLPTETITSSLSIKYSPQADWQIYADEKARFSFQYNSVFSGQNGVRQSVVHSDPGRGVTINSCFIAEAGPAAGKEICSQYFSIGIYENYQGGSRREWMKANINDSLSCLKQYSDILIAGKNALVATSDCSSWGETYILIPNGSQMIVFIFQQNIRDEKTGNVNLPDDWQKTLATFKFL